MYSGSLHLMGGWLKGSWVREKHNVAKKMMWGNLLADMNMLPGAITNTVCVYKRGVSRKRQIMMPMSFMVLYTRHGAATFWV